MSIKLEYKTHKCTLCGDCVEQCPAGALDLFTGVIAWVRLSCIGCNTCKNSCKNKAIRCTK